MNGKAGLVAVLRQQTSRETGSVGGQFTAPVGFDMHQSGGLRVISLAAEECPSAGKRSRNNSDAIFAEMSRSVRTSNGFLIVG